MKVDSGRIADLRKQAESAGPDKDISVHGASIVALLDYFDARIDRDRELLREALPLLTIMIAYRNLPELQPLIARIQEAIGEEHE